MSRRFVTIREKPKEIISDNVPQFKVTKNVLDILWECIASSLLVHTKMYLGKNIGKLSLTSSQLQTVLSAVEAIVNTRPLPFVEIKLKPRKITNTNVFLIYKSSKCEQLRR